MRKYCGNGELDVLYTSEARIFQVFRVQDGWMALAKGEPFVSLNDPVNEVGDLWYAFGDSDEEALVRLKLELRREGVPYAEPVA